MLLTRKPDKIRQDILSLVYCDLSVCDFSGCLKLLPFCFDWVIITHLSLDNCLIILFGDKWSFLTTNSSKQLWLDWLLLYLIYNCICKTIISPIHLMTPITGCRIFFKDVFNYTQINNIILEGFKWSGIHVISTTSPRPRI